MHESLFERNKKTVQILKLVITGILECAKTLHMKRLVGSTKTVPTVILWKTKCLVEKKTPTKGNKKFRTLKGSFKVWLIR